MKMELPLSHMGLRNLVVFAPVENILNYNKSSHVQIRASKLDLNPHQRDVKIKILRVKFPQSFPPKWRTFLLAEWRKEIQKKKKMPK